MFKWKFCFLRVDLSITVRWLKYHPMRMLLLCCWDCGWLGLTSQPVSTVVDEWNIFRTSKIAFNLSWRLALVKQCPACQGWGLNQSIPIPYIQVQCIWPGRYHETAVTSMHWTSSDLCTHVDLLWYSWDTTRVPLLSLVTCKIQR